MNIIKNVVEEPRERYVLPYITNWIQTAIVKIEAREQVTMPTLSEAQSTAYHHLRQICVYLHFTIMHKVIGVI